MTSWTSTTPGAACQAGRTTSATGLPICCSKSLVFPGRANVADLKRVPLYFKSSFAYPPRMDPHKLLSKTRVTWTWERSGETLPFLLRGQISEPFCELKGGEGVEERNASQSTLCFEGTSVKTHVVLSLFFVAAFCW